MMSKEQKQTEDFRTTIGGQALIEGILMRGPDKQSTVVRTPDGKLVSKVEEPHFLKEKLKFFGWPLIRGTVTFLEAMVYGVKALTYSAEMQPETQEEPSKFEKWIEKTFGSEKADKFFIGVAVVLGICLSVGLFILLPTFLAGFVRGFTDSSAIYNLTEGVLRLVIFLVYLFLCTQSKELKRVFRYHGAEHKTIFCYEKGLPLTVENAREQSRFHPRCGTSFLLVVMIISILVFSFIRWHNVWVRMALRILLLPVVVGISYEIQRWAGRHDNRFTAIITAPGKWLQKLTTAEPDDSMLECAIEALILVIPEEKGLDAW